MARTSVSKSKEAVWVTCPIPEFSDERHLIRPSTRESLSNIRDKSQAKEWENGAIVTKPDSNLFDQNYIDYIWAGWGEHVGIEHEDGRIEDPAEVTLKNKMILVNSRPIEFLLWLQRAATDLAAQSQQQVEAERETFREVHPTPARPPEA
jgi:hypothetical protein